VARLINEPRGVAGNSSQYVLELIKGFWSLGKSGRGKYAPAVSLKVSCLGFHHSTENSVLRKKKKKKKKNKQNGGEFVASIGLPRVNQDNSSRSMQ